MSTSNNISRRQFLKTSVLAASTLAVFPAGLSSCSKPIDGGMANDNSKAGHLLREENFNKIPEKTVDIPVLIVGAGISGLSCGYGMAKEGRNDFLILDLADTHGGNSSAGSNAVSAYPWAAHYLPIVNNSNIELLEFLREQNVITGFDAAGLPIYNEYYLCFDPEERLFINGHWQDGLVPAFGIGASDKKQIARFFELVKDYRQRVGSDGKYAFDIPVKNSSQDETFRALDKIPFADFLKSHAFDSPYLLWYLEYCCKDDYGSTLKDSSAYAGLHYFCSRRAKAANAESSAVLTWPQGNAFLSDRLYQSCSDKVRTGQLVRSVNIVNGRAEALCLDTHSGACTLYRCDQLVLCTPQYVNQRILADTLKAGRGAAALFEYTPWLVANLTLRHVPHYPGEPLSWDNVIYDSPSVGYVNACHQHLERATGQVVLTYYHPLTQLPPKEARSRFRGKTFEELLDLVLKDLAPSHKNIADYVERADIRLWGHGMIKPKPDFIFNPAVNACAEHIEQVIFFAHSDLAGISIFEEAFAQGITVAKQLQALHDAHTTT